ncbi:MAG: DUF5372 family protein [Acetobacteraceae bacterium]
MQLFRVTHPFHPLYGREFALADRRLTWGEDRVYYYDEAGTLRRLPASWTSIAAAGVFEVVSGGRAHFRVDDLQQLVALIARQREARPRVQGKTRRRPSSKLRREGK